MVWDDGWDLEDCLDGWVKDVVLCFWFSTESVVTRPATDILFTIQLIVFHFISLICFQNESESYWNNYLFAFCTWNRDKSEAVRWHNTNVLGIRLSDINLVLRCRNNINYNGRWKAYYRNFARLWPGNKFDFRRMPRKNVPFGSRSRNHFFGSLCSSWR